jgi:hypothetical protein
MDNLRGNLMTSFNNLQRDFYDVRTTINRSVSTGKRSLGISLYSLCQRKAETLIAQKSRQKKLEKLLSQNSLSSGFQTLQNPKGDRLKNSIETIAQSSADHIRDQIRDIRGAIKERL